MNAFAAAFLGITALAMVSLPRRWVLLPLLAAACYMTNAQAIEVGPFHFTVLRILLLIGFLRALSQGEGLPGGFCALDKVLVIWGCWLLCSSAFHRPFVDALVFRLGEFYNVLGIYFLIRIFCQNTDDLLQIVKITAIILVPVAIEMVNEKLTHRNFFGFLGGVPIEVLERDDKFRAQGPFGHPILAGTVGSLCVPLLAAIWRRNPILAKLGVAACLAMVLASTSSGPLMTLFFALFALALWRHRKLIRPLRIGAVVAYLVCDMLMTRPAYYLLEKIDLTGSSAGYHRAALIDAAIQHLNEWWEAGTDYTRHWLPYGVSWSPNHVDITNHYIFYGVDGGLPLMLLFIAALWIGFRYVRQSLLLLKDAPPQEQFLIWAAGSGLFAHTTTMVSVAYFDQSVMFLYLNLAIIASLRAHSIATAAAEALPPTTGINHMHKLGAS